MSQRRIQILGPKLAVKGRLPPWATEGEHHVGKGIPGRRTCALKLIGLCACYINLASLLRAYLQPMSSKVHQSALQASIKVQWYTRSEFVAGGHWVLCLGLGWVGTYHRLGLKLCWTNKESIYCRRSIIMHPCLSKQSRWDIIESSGVIKVRSHCYLSWRSGCGSKKAKHSRPIERIYSIVYRFL